MAGAGRLTYPISPALPQTPVQLLEYPGWGLLLEQDGALYGKGYLS